MVLTAAGRRVLETARRVLGEIARTEEDLRRLAGHSDGSIRVCTECNTGYHWLGPLLTSFRRKHPRVAVHIAADATADPVAALLEGRVDLAILIDPRAGPPASAAAAVRRRDGGDRRQGGSAGAAALDRRRGTGGAAPAALQQRPKTASCCAGCLRPAGLTAARVSFIMLTEAMIELAAAGTGVGILPRWSAQRAIAGGVVARLVAHPARHAAAVGGGDAERAARPALLADFLDLLADRALPARAGAMPMSDFIDSRKTIRWSSYPAGR